MTSVRWANQYGSWVGGPDGQFVPSAEGLAALKTHDFKPEPDQPGISRCRKCGQRVQGSAAAFSIGPCTGNEVTSVPGNSVEARAALAIGEALFSQFLSQLRPAAYSWDPSNATISIPLLKGTLHIRCLPLTLAALRAAEAAKSKSL